ncbi:toxin-antitoxin system protein [Bdellovibrionota bacterium FG-1]
MAVTAKISQPTHDTLKQLSEKTGKPMQLVLDEAVENYRRAKFFEELNSQVLAVKSNPKAWEEELAERKLWEGALSDESDDKK